MWICILFTLLGFLLVFFEFFLPGGLIVILGGLFLVAGITYFSVLDYSLLATLLYFIGTGVGTILSCKSAIWAVQRRSREEIFLSGDQAGFVAAAFEKELIGGEAEVINDLKPSGFISKEGRRLPALSESGYLMKGTKVEIIKGQGSSYIVKEVK